MRHHYHRLQFSAYLIDPAVAINLSLRAQQHQQSTLTLTTHPKLHNPAQSSTRPPSPISLLPPARALSVEPFLLSLFSFLLFVFYSSMSKTRASYVFGQPTCTQRFPYAASSRRISRTFRASNTCRITFLFLTKLYSLSTSTASTSKFLRPAIPSASTSGQLCPSTQKASPKPPPRLPPSDPQSRKSPR
jgi:hypothetical protein